MIRFDGRTAIVTGAGNGLGRSHALLLAERGANVVVNDLGGSVAGAGASLSAAQGVVEEINDKGGHAMAHGADVTNADQVADMVDQALKAFGSVDILVNNAGILRDKSFAKMDVADFALVLNVHLMGSVTCTKAVWDYMKEQNYGRIAMTSSSSGIYGNFGQANYGAAKMGLVGLMNVLSIEGKKNDIRINTLSPTAATRMTKGLLPQAALDLMSVESVSAALAYLVSDDAPERTILCAGAGGYAATRIYETQGIYLPPDEQTPEAIADNFDRILDPNDQDMLTDGSGQTLKFVAAAAKHFGVSLG
jgi:NAD(P)-dependent dehydrogenase (short-subunit alcohol dehydrogenase family)